MPIFDSSTTTQDALSILIQNFNENKTNEKQINGEDFLFDTPALDTFVGSNARSTLMRVRPLFNSGQIGHIALRYERIDLTQLADYTHIANHSTKVFDIITDINAHFGINLVSRDYINVDLPPAGNSVIVPVRPISYLFVGQFTIKVL